jgi:hypothetical protein
MAVIFVSKLGKTSAGERSRIWLEGQRLIDVGFNPGDKIMKRWTDDALTIKRITESEWEALDRQGVRITRGRVSGKGDKPIIDIVGAVVKETFGVRGERVEVRFKPGLLEIKSSKAKMSAAK